MNNRKMSSPNSNNTRTQRISSLGINEQNSKQVEQEKSSMEKVAKFLASTYYNISKILIFSGVIVGGWVLLTNYNVFPVIEKIFVRDENPEKTKETLVQITGLDFNKDVVKEEEFKSIKNKIDSEMSSIILERSLFDEGQTAFNSQMKAYYTQSYFEKTTTDDVLYNSLSKIYGFKNRYPYSVSLTSIGKVIKNNSAVTKAIIDINAVDDDRGFHVTSIALFFNDKYEITDMKVVFENKDYVNTRTPLDEKYSLITNSNTTNMVKEINKFIKDFTNKALYDKMQISAIDITNSQLKSFLSNLDIVEKDYDVLSELFKLIKGNTNNMAIVEYMQTDFDVVPVNSLVIAVKTTEKVYKYNLEFNRDSEKLVSISRI